MLPSTAKRYPQIIREAPRIEEKLKPLLKQRAATIRATLRGHTEHVQGYLEEVNSAPFKYYVTEWSPALGDLDKQNARLKKEQARKGERLSRLLPRFQ